MATNYITIRGYIKNGELKVDLPENVEDGEVEMTIPVSETEELPWEERPWTEAELEEFLDFKGLSLGEIVNSGMVGIGADADMEIEDDDSLKFIENLRRREEKRRGNWMLS